MIERLQAREPNGTSTYLSPADVLNLPPGELTNRMTDLVPMIADHAQEAEQLRRPVDEVWYALRQSGYFYQFVPRRFGGMATDLESFIDATLPIAEACASTGWTASFCAAHNRNLANFPLSVQEEIWQGEFPYVIAPQLAFSTEPVAIDEVDGGLRVTGSWEWGTGVMHADWIFAVSSLRKPDSTNQMVMLLFPADQVSILDTWYPDGLAGTGSNRVLADNLFIPERRVLRDMGMMSGQGGAARLYPEAVYRVPFFSFGQVVSSVVALGAARRVVKLSQDNMKERVLKMSTAKQADKPLAQARLAKADTMVRNAELIMRDGAKNVAALTQGEPDTQASRRIAFRTNYTYAVGLCREAALLLAEGAGSSVHRISDPFQRAVRDICMLASHVAFDPDTSYEMQGRSLLGLAPQTMMF